MTNTVLALIGYVSWFLVLLVMIEISRAFIVIQTGRSANAFLPDGSDVSPFVNRLSRAHANCYESFPFVGGILLFAIASGNTEETDSMALWLLGARIAQSGIHLFSGAAAFAQIRFVFFVIQIAIVVYWLIGFVS